MVELVDTRDLKSLGEFLRASSILALATIIMKEKLDQAKIELYRLLLSAKHPDDLTDNEVDLMYHLSYETCIQDVLSEAVNKPQS